MQLNHSRSGFDVSDYAVDHTLSVFGSSTKSYDAFEPDGVGGDLKAGTSDTLLILTTDSVPDTVNSTHTVAVDGAHIISTIDTIGDQDFFAVELTAGNIYDIGQYLVSGGPSGTPLADAYIEIYDAAGNLITSADGGGPNTPSGLDALLTFVPEESGTYYINARAYDNDGTNGTTGDFVGDYELFVDDVSDRPSYVPYYDLDSPLHSIDWGSQVDRTSRNPDGEEGPRVTGNPYTGVGSNPYGIEGKNVITVYFAKAGDVFVSEDPANPGLTTTIVAQGMQAWELEAFELALDQFEQVADVVFVTVDNREEADFKVITYSGTPGVGPSLLGRMSPPNENNEGQAEFNAGDVRWSEEGLQQSGFYFSTLLHEFGHGMGMAHPHDNGGRSSIMRGAGGGTAGIGGGLGDFNLSQQVHTVMSYNDGWATSPYGQPRSSGTTGTDHYGWVGTLSPLDIAVIQDKYGVNEEWATGDDTYTIKDVNAPGTFYSSIWDGGGTDQIVYDGARDTTIDLRPATLQYEEGGGGRVSFAFGIHGGFTIANSVTIENARSGSGNDRLTGNAANNTLSSGAGNDQLDGGAGVDTMVGGTGSDTYYVDDAGDVIIEAVDEGTDWVKASVSHTLAANVEVLTLTGTAAIDGTGNALANTLRGNSAANTLTGGAGSDTLNGGGGADTMVGGADNDTYRVDDSGDVVTEATRAGTDLVKSSISYTLGANVEQLTLLGTAAVSGTGNKLSNVLTGNEADNRLRGEDGTDALLGGSGADTLHGGRGADVLTGGGGADNFHFDTPVNGTNVDKIKDFAAADDTFVLAQSTFTAIAAGTLDANAFQLGTAAADADDRIIYDSATGKIYYDADGNGDGAQVLFAQVTAGVALTNADFQIVG